jgi:predicted membrane channel-forming protein YqfA (hemolysin III family)
VRLGSIAGAVFGAAWAVLGVSILRKGSFRLFRDENVVHGLTFGFTLLLLIVLLLLGGQNADRTTGIQMMLFGGIFFLVFGIPAIFNMRINRAESTLREQLLKLELQIAEIAEKTKPKE